MSYIALYRKYRPDTFDGIVGQDNVINILKKQVQTSKISHAYLFSGTRGTGKTSAAKVFARAINCLNPKNGEPCNECSSCKSILEGDMTDVVEMDAASNNSVENIRQIRTEVMYAASNVKYRVYIIDEVHMLTTSAFNALLKTLEEPPENVVFILATTEQHKIPVTILSRCLRFEFNKITNKHIIDRIKYVLTKENITFEQEAVEYIATLADGGMRDALSILDRCLTEDRKVLKLDIIQDIIGSIDIDILNNITEGILNNNSKVVIDNLEILIEKSRDLRQLVYELMKIFLDKLINSKVEEESKLYNNIIDELSLLDSEIKLSTKPELIIKSVLVRISNGRKITVDESVGVNNNFDYTRISNLEKQIIEFKELLKNVNIVTVPSNSNNNSINEISKSKENNINKEKVNNAKKMDFNFENFKNILPSIGKVRLFGIMSSCKYRLTETEFLLGTDNDFAYKILNEGNEIKEIEDILKSKFSITVPVKIKYLKKDNSSKLEKILKENNFEYTDLDK